jgi:hypothetical protein
MKKKTLIITLIDGRVIHRDITLDNLQVPIGAPANHPSYAMLCQSIGVSGYTDIDSVTESSYTHIAPSQIKCVTVTIEK